MAVQVAVQSLGSEAATTDGLTRLQYTGPQQGSFVLRGPSGQSYKVGQGRLIDAKPEDLAWLESFGTFQRVVVASITSAPAAVDVAGAAATMSEATPVVTEDVTVLVSEPVSEPDPPAVPRRKKKEGAASA